MSPIGFPPPSARFPILSESVRPTAIRPASPGAGEVKSGERPARPDHPHRTDRPARPERPVRPEGPVDVTHRGRSELAHITRNFVHEAKTIMKNGGTMEDVETLAKTILEKLPALEKFPPFQKLLERIAYNLNNGAVPIGSAPVDPVPVDPVPIEPVPIDPGGLDPTEAGASLKKPETEIAVEPGTTLPLTGVSIDV